ncbi:MAG: undecaprenyl/decaprenyl-phosphate alpha-N-acetylglucosaminyl 1-phosphate transferase [Acidobacteria bacterium]|nr:undecaprenyl/decaprenyl-phosphate alpha-N-acetylglucosaminyl 1-phosphate transferase [Acidobacteriota bacterium]
MIWYLVAFALAATIALYTTPLMRQAAIRFGIVDRPDGRLKRQEAPVPYLGGLAIYLSFILALTATRRFDSTEVLGLLLAGAIVVILGLIDDFGVLSPGAKLAGQVVAVLTLINSSIYIKLGFLPPWAAIALSFLWLLAIINAFNIIDVMDGLAAGVAAGSAFILFLIAAFNGRQTYAILLAALCGSLLGFLRYNFAPARIYMGDAGSMFIGLMLGALGMNNSYTRENLVASLAPVVILGVPIFDMLFVMYVRFRRGLPVMLGSPDHFALRLRKWRLSTRQTVLGSWAATLLLGALAIGMMLSGAATALAILVAIVLASTGLGFFLRRIDMSL